MKRRRLVEIAAAYVVFGVGPNVAFHLSRNHAYHTMSLDTMNTEEMRGIYRLAADKSAEKVFRPSVLIPMSFIFTDGALPYEEYNRKNVLH